MDINETARRASSAVELIQHPGDAAVVDRPAWQRRALGFASLEAASSWLQDFERRNAA